MPFSKFTNSNLQVGYSIKADTNAYIPKPVILYDYGVIQTLSGGQHFHFNDSSSSVPLTTYNLFGQDTLISSVVNTINWGAEQSSFTDKIEPNSLFSNYYSAYLSNTFNQKARLLKLKAFMPISLLSKLALNDKLIIRDKRYIINSYQTELTTGETSFELMSDLRNISLDSTTTTTTSTTTTSTTTTTTTAIPNPDYRLVIIQPNCDTNQYGVIIIDNVINGDRYKVCEGTTFTCPNTGCSMPDGYIINGTANYETNYMNQSATKNYVIRVYNGNNCNAYTDIATTLYSSFCTTTTTTTPRPTFPCESYQNQSGSNRTISYTSCDGIIFTRVNIGNGAIVCAQYETLGGTGASYMTMIGQCTTTTTTTIAPTTTTTTTARPTFPCENYLNNSGSNRTISYTSCDGVIFTNVNIGPGSSICAQYETLAGTGASFLTFTGQCTTTTTTTTAPPNGSTIFYTLK
jgi:hypothetical protein